ncbi:hypothetical protein GUJ93_ZPchr0010g10942 [Zizania palustris]|uniref:Uncharacterized protein n=1 Tax=Zizania palustris TaxID=103762 RepID=A0A8J5WBP8_ZIZPA|nr:hypothetical protein GUJ93_ZPchr0010g10942 [Zizania palustris]KAG8087795.1 hypothetical protein GUJ93_ZPchr0010g10942 [Zizania palustris]
MAESLLLPVVRGVVGKAADVLVQSVTRMCGVDGDRRKLERQLLAVQCKLMDAEEKSETNPAVKRWMKDLKAVAYEADDVLYDFQYEALRREAQIGDSATRKVLCYFTPQSPLLFRATMSRKLNNVINKINELIEEMNRFGLMDRTEPPQLPYRQTHSALDDSADIMGRDDDKGIVVKLLMEQQDQHKVQVLPIVGMGGLGKTTLAKMVYNDYMIQNHFELKMWHCVSENFEVASLLKSIIQLATDKYPLLPDTIELLLRKLQEVIGRKRFLLVLDDVWNEEEKKWEDDLKPLLSSVGYRGSVILITTRSPRVASIMGTLQQSHELACLNDDDSWKLFSKIAFSRGVQEQAELVSNGRLIVEKCRGLPLALKTMGGLMSSKQLVKEWKTIADSNIGGNARYGILPILKLSYTHLSPEMKQCFAFCSVFPKDYDMDKEKLIQLWLANGFIQEDSTTDLIQKGEDVFHNLVLRSFLQDVKAVIGNFTQHELILCKMHDLMHDLAKGVADECITLEQMLPHKASIGNVHHMYISRSYFEGKIMRLLKGTPSLRTFLAEYPYLMGHDLKELRQVSLRALQFGVPRDYHIPRQVINHAKNVRYLDLSFNYIVMLPNSVCLMYNLHTLRLNGCGNLKHLPKGMSTMKKLIHVYLMGCDSLKRMPPNISLLKNLHTLTRFIVDAEAGHGIEELKDLHHLSNRLELYNLGKINSMENGKEANLHEKENLSELLLYWGGYKDYMSENIVCNEEEVLESLTPHGKLKVLELHGYSGVKIPERMRDPKMFQCLRVLHISNCPGCKDLPAVQLSVSLEHLVLSNMKNLTTLCNNVGVEAEGHTIPLQIFPKLKYLELSYLSKLEKWAENTVGDANKFGMFPELETVEIIDCGKLASVPDCPVLKKLNTQGCPSLAMSSLAHLTMLSGLVYTAVNISSVNMSLGSWPSLVTLTVELSYEMMTPLEIDENQGPLENLRRLELCGLSFFTSTFTSSQMHARLWKCFTFVKELRIHSCNDLVRWPTEELTSLIHLRVLRITSCDNLEGKGSSSDDIPNFPASLKELYIYECPRLVALPSNLGNLARLKYLTLHICECLKELPAGMDGLTSLKHLRIDGCNGLKELPGMDGLISLEELTIDGCNGLKELPGMDGLISLEELTIDDCNGLKELPAGMDGLASLEKLKIRSCPRIEKLPQGLLQRLATLKSLRIQGCCPVLQRRCREGGEYFELLSSIPERYIDAAVKESMVNMKRLVKRFNPSC